MQDRLAAVKHFLNSWASITADGAALCQQRSAVLGWILHDGVRSLWKQLYELQRRQLHLTWSKLYEETEAEDDDTIVGKDASDEIHVVVEYWFGVLRMVLEKVDSSVLYGGKHRHCDIVEPLMAGVFGFDGTERQRHEAKKGEMYREHEEEPRQLNMMVHAKVAHVMDAEMGDLKLRVREWVGEVKGSSPSLDGYRVKLW
jgi:hypothetical protein